MDKKDGKRLKRKSSRSVQPDKADSMARGRGEEGWEAVVSHMHDVILSSLSLEELLLASGTCKSFRACFHRRLEHELTARDALANKWPGSAGITCLGELLNGFLDRHRPVHPQLEDNGHSICCISPDGKLRMGEERDVSPVPSATPEDLEMRVTVWKPRYSLYRKFLIIYMPTANGGFVHIRVSVSPRARKLVITVAPSHGEDVVGVALVHALLTQGLEEAFRGPKTPIKVCLEGCFLGSKGAGFTEAALEAQVLPLRPLVQKPCHWKIGFWKRRRGQFCP